MAISAVQSDRRTRREQLMQNETERVAQAAQMANLGLWGWYPDGSLFWATPTAMSLLDLPHGLVLNMESMLDLVHPDDQPGMRAGIMRVMQTGEAEEFEIRQLREGKPRWHRVRISAGRDLAGRHQLSGSIVDISENRRIEAEMEGQRRSLTHLSRVGMLGELGGALAHELKQPLTAILSNAQALQRLLERKAIDKKEVRAVIRDIINDDSRATAVIQHLRSLLKPGEFQGRTLNLNDVVADTLELVRNDLMTRRIAVSTALHSHNLTVVGDCVHLQQLLLNLIFNATEAMAEKNARGEMLLIATDLMEGPSAHIAVSDTGPGIKSEIMERLFEPFVSTKAQGLGLGLSISRAIVTSHKGRIWAHNNPGRGATFHVTLPLAEPK
jgi:C4-dicarboxylate-specific signal transduction histidine kinase